MSNKAETQYNPQCGVRRTIFSDEYDFLTKIESVCAKEDGTFFGTYMERPYSHSSYYIFDTIGIQICDGAGDDCKKPQTDGSRRCT